MTEYLPTDDNVAPIPHRRSIGRWLSALSVAAIALATLTPASRSGSFEPFCVICGSTGGVDAVLNLLLFMPLGLGLALIGVRPARAVQMMCAFTLAIESLQFSIVHGRDASLGDVLTNSAGGIVGYLAGTRLERLLWPDVRMARRLTVAWTALWLAVQVVSAYAFVPAIPVSLYYGQLARDFEDGAPVFGGKVVSATVATESIPDWEMANPARLRALLTRPGGALVQATLLPTGCPSGLAPIIRVAASGDREILNLSQRGSDLVFGIRTGAELLRLQRVRFQLRGAFASACAAPYAGERLMVMARYAPREISLRAATSSATTASSIRPRLSESWRLFLPVQTYLADNWLSIVVGASWMALLGLPFGYWSLSSVRPAARANPRALALAALSAAGIGLLLQVTRLGPVPASWWESLTTACGVVTGALLSGYVFHSLRARTRVKQRAVSHDDG